MSGVTSCRVCPFHQAEGFSIDRSQAILLASYRASAAEVEAMLAGLAHSGRASRGSEGSSRGARAATTIRIRDKKSVRRLSWGNPFAWGRAMVSRFQLRSLAHLIALHPDKAAELLAQKQQGEAA